MNRRTRTVYLVPYVLWILLFVVAPILLIVYYSFFVCRWQFYGR